jgi:chromosomal replication initiator protein
LESNLSKSDFDTWFSQTNLKKLDPELAIIQVPNKFVAGWLQDKYLVEIKKSFEKILKRSPEIHFIYDLPPGAQDSTKFPSKEPDLYHRHSLNPLMTFGQLVTGNCNRFACSSAKEVANSPANQYNPLYIYCPSGLGKTHLLNAIGNQVLSDTPYSKPRYVSSDTFTSDFAYSIKNARLYEFRDKYCGLDLLLFDDVQLLANRKKTQEEFLFIFNTLYGAKKKIVLTANCPPNELKNITSPLRSRFASGLLAEIQSPDQDTKINIIRKKATEANLNISEDVVFFLATSTNDIKTLLKNIVRLEAYASLSNGNISISLLKSVIKDMGKVEIEIEDIKASTAGYFNIAVSDLISNKKKRAYSYPRQVAMYLSRKYTDLSFKEIGDSFGHKEHSTVIYAVRRIQKHKDGDKNILDDLVKIEKLLGSTI